MGKTLIKIKNVNVFVDCPGLEGDSEDFSFSDTLEEFLDALCGGESIDEEEKERAQLADVLTKEHGIDPKTAAKIAEDFYRWKEEA